jgi:hypothetical protein
MRATQVSITCPFTDGIEYGLLTPTELSAATVYVYWTFTFDGCEVPSQDPALQRVVHLLMTESDPIGFDVPFHVPSTSASVSAGAAAGATASTVWAVSAGGVSVFAQATTANTAGIK